MIDSKKTGFTIVELLIVIVVIAILAAITIVAFNGIQERARISSVSSALSQANKKIALFQVDNPGQYPADLSSLGITNTADVSYQYSVNNTTNPATYCITATNGSTSYKSSSASSTPSSGGCAGHGVGGVAAVTNLVTNPSAETSISNFGINNSGLVSRTRDTLAAYSGSYGQRLTYSSAGTFAGVGPYIQVTNLASDKSYTGSVWIRSSSNLRYAITLERRNASGTNLGNVTGTAVSLTPNTWTRLTAEIPATATMTQLTFCVYQISSTAAVGDTVDIDALMLTEGTGAPSYADGSSANWLWNGTAHSSTSTGPAL